MSNIHECYKIRYDEQIGQGGFGKVYRGFNLRSGENVAVKALEKAQIKEKGMEGRVYEEVQLHSRFVHPNIVRFIDCFDEEQYFSLVAIS